MDPSILLQAQGVKLADPMQYAAQALSLADLASRRELQRYAIAKQQREDEAASLLSRALPAFLRAGMTDEALTQAPPEVQQSLFALQQRSRKERADVDKTLAETDAKRADVKQKALRDISNVAYEEVKNPNNLSLSRVNRVAKFYGVDLPQMPTDPRDVNGVRDYLSMLGNAGYDVKDRESLAETKRGHDLTAATAAEGQRVTMRGQNLADARARQELAERIRNNNMTDARSRDANAAASGTRSSSSIVQIRKEIESLPDEKNYRAALPILRSVAKAPDTPAGDLDLIYGVGKVLDPGSVVREGEMVMVTNSQSPLLRVLGTAQWAKGNGRLTPRMRQELVEMLNGRVAELAQAREDALTPYRAQVRAEGLPEDQLFTPLKLPEHKDGWTDIGGGLRVRPAR